MSRRCEDCENTAALFCPRHAAMFVEGEQRTQAARERNKLARKKQSHPPLFDVSDYGGSFRFFGNESEETAA